MTSDDRGGAGRLHRIGGTMDRGELADFLRRRRAALQPEDVGLPRGTRRRTGGLRREEVAVLVGMSPDYYSRLEQQRGPQPSEQMVAAIARGLRLTVDERDHLFVLAGHTAPLRTSRTDHVSPGLLRILDRLHDTPAQVMTELGETVLQTKACVALVGEQTRHTGLRRSVFYRWFTDTTARSIYPVVDHPMHARIYVAQLRAALARGGPTSRAASLARALHASSKEFVAIWEQHEIGVRYSDTKAFTHHELGEMTLHCQLLVDPDQQQTLLVYTPTPSSESSEKYRMLAVLGDQFQDSVGR